MQNSNGGYYLFKAILWAEIVTLLPLLFSIVGVSLSSQLYSLFKYATRIIATYFLLNAVLKYHLRATLIQKLFILWIILLYLTAIPEIINPYNNFLQLKMFLDALMFLYLVPLMMIAELDISFFKKYFKLCYVLAVFYLFFSILFAKYDNEGFTLFAEGAIILIMTWTYHSPRKRTVIVFVLLIAIIGMMLAVRRNRVVYFGGGLTLAFVVNILQNNTYSNRRKTTLILLSMALGVGLYFSSDYFFVFFDKMRTGMDSREGVIELFIDDFNRQPTDWVFGRGLFGRFDAGLLNTYEDLEGRDAIENGYLQLILKGGLIWLVSLTIIALNAVYKGLFRSKNTLCKGFAMIIILYYVDMIGFGVPQTSLKYFIIFIAIAGCNTPWLRMCTDEYLAKEIGLKNKK